jgi:hypothetical protein
MRSFKRGHKIKVVYANGVADLVSPDLLDSLLVSKRVDQFERSDGWAELGIDPIRGMGGPIYDGQNRRLN